MIAYGCRRFTTSARFLRYYVQSSHTKLLPATACSCTRLHTGSFGLGKHDEGIRDEGAVPTQTGLGTLQTVAQKRIGLAERMVNSSPRGVKPYLKLMRIDKPIGSWLLFWPCGWSIAMASPAGAFPDPTLLALFGIGALVMRGAGCTINDMCDQDIDGMVARTKDRPLVTGEISPLQAFAFLTGQLTTGLMIALQLNWYTLILGTSSLVFVTSYPFMKRITNWPQLVLGMTFNFGALMGWSAVQGSCDWAVCLPLYVACVSWTIFYDTIYAHQDKLDDIAVGVKSTALRFGDKTKLYISGFGVVMLTGLLASGILSAQIWPYYTSLGIVSSHLAHQIYTLKPDNSADCAKKFASNHRIGLILFLGIVFSTLLKEPLTKGEDKPIDVDSAKSKNSPYSPKEKQDNQIAILGSV